MEPFFLTAFISLILTVPTIFLAKKFNVITDAKSGSHPAHTHKGIVPRAGGVPVFLGILITVLVFIPLNKILIGILLCCALLVLMGLLDDIYNLSPYARFGGNIIVACVAVAFGLGIPFISNPLGGVIRLDTFVIAFDFFGPRSIWVIADLLSIIWLTAIMNMINWSKGVDGQLPGFVSITAFFLAILAVRFTAHDISVAAVATLAFAVSGAFLGFLPFNLYPQKIMPGYGGGSLAGFLLGVLAIMSFGKLGTATLILAIPLIDAAYTLMRRILKKKSPFRADWGHFHHRLLDIGWGRRRIATFYLFISAILGVSSLFLDGLAKFLAFCTIGIILLAFMLIIERVKKNRNIALKESSVGLDNDWVG